MMEELRRADKIETMLYWRKLILLLMKAGRLDPGLPQDDQKGENTAPLQNHPCYGQFAKTAFEIAQHGWFCQSLKGNFEACYGQFAKTALSYGQY
jgi:hypothetical protein